MGNFEILFKATSISLVFLIFSLQVELGLGEGKVKSKTTPEEKIAAEKLRTLAKDVLYRDFMNEDYYLLRFLRARNFDINGANEMLRQAIKWRKEEKIDNIVNEESTQLEKNFPYFTDAFDNEGRPVTSWGFGRWDIRKISLAGGMPELVRYVAKLLEETDVNLRKQREVTGKDVTHHVMIIDGNGFGLRSHACLTCLPFYYGFISQSDQYYPQAAKNVYMINFPRVADQVMNIIRPLMSPHQREVLKIFGHNKDEYRAEFSKTINLDQLRPEFGGNYRPQN